MADILKVYTADQLYTMYRNYLLSKNTDLTDFNEGSKIRALIESNSEITSSISLDYKEALYQAIPIALYKGFGFKKLEATNATGFIRAYRTPALTIEYTGVGTEAKITSTANNIVSAVTGVPSDAFSFAYATYDDLETLANAIDDLTNWSATLVKSATIPTSSLYQYTSVDSLATTDYTNSFGSMDLMLSDAIAVTIPEGFSSSIDQKTILSTAEVILVAGESSAILPCEVQNPGLTGNIIVRAIDTVNGKGVINSNIDEVEQIINDSSFSGGTEAESDSDRKTRFALAVNSLDAGTENGIISAIKGVTGVRSAGMRTSFPFKGTNTIIVDSGSGSISPSLLADIERVLYGDPNDIINFPGKNAEGIGYNIVAPTIIDVSASITVTRLPTVNVDLTEIKDDVQTAVEQYINTRALGENVLISEIVRVGKNSNAGAYDLIVVSPATNVAIDDNEFSKTGSGTSGIVSVTISVATSV